MSKSRRTIDTHSTSSLGEFYFFVTTADSLSELMGEKMVCRPNCSECFCDDFRVFGFKNNQKRGKLNSGKNNRNGEIGSGEK